MMSFAACFLCPYMNFAAYGYIVICISVQQVTSVMGCLT